MCIPSFFSSRSLFLFHLIFFFRTLPVCSEDDEEEKRHIQITGQYYYSEKRRKNRTETNQMYTHIYIYLSIISQQHSLENRHIQYVCSSLLASYQSRTEKKRNNRLPNKFSLVLQNLVFLYEITYECHILYTYYNLIFDRLYTIRKKTGRKKDR